MGPYNLPHALGTEISAGSERNGLAVCLPGSQRGCRPPLRRHPSPSCGPQCHQIKRLSRGCAAAALTKAITPIPSAIHLPPLLQRGTDIRTLQHLLGHTDVATTMIYNVLQQGGQGVPSPLDDLAC